MSIVFVLLFYVQLHIILFDDDKEWWCILLARIGFANECFLAFDKHGCCIIANQSCLRQTILWWIALLFLDWMNHAVGNHVTTMWNRDKDWLMVEYFIYHTIPHATTWQVRFEDGICDTVTADVIKREKDSIFLASIVQYHTSTYWDLDL